MHGIGCKKPSKKSNGVFKHAFPRVFGGDQFQLPVLPRPALRLDPDDPGREGTDILYGIYDGKSVAQDGTFKEGPRWHVGI